MHTDHPPKKRWWLWTRRGYMELDGRVYPMPHTQPLRRRLTVFAVKLLALVLTIALAFILGIVGFQLWHTFG